MEGSINKLKEKAYYMSIHTGSIDTGENWEADAATALREGDHELSGWDKGWRDSMVQVDQNGQEIEEDLSEVDKWLERYLVGRKQ